MLLFNTLRALRNSRYNKQAKELKTILGLPWRAPLQEETGGPLEVKEGCYEGFCASHILTCGSSVYLLSDGIKLGVKND